MSTVNKHVGEFTPLKKMDRTLTLRGMGTRRPLAPIAQNGAEKLPTPRMVEVCPGVTADVRGFGSAFDGMVSSGAISTMCFDSKDGRYTVVFHPEEETYEFQVHTESEVALPPPHYLPKEAKALVPFCKLFVTHKLSRTIWLHRLLFVMSSGEFELSYSMGAWDDTMLRNALTRAYDYACSE
jgi:hypothetical protein